MGTAAASAKGWPVRSDLLRGRREGPSTDRHVLAWRPPNSPATRARHRVPAAREQGRRRTQVRRTVEGEGGTKPATPPGRSPPGARRLPPAGGLHRPLPHPTSRRRGPEPKPACASGTKENVPPPSAPEVEHAVPPAPACLSTEPQIASENTRIGSSDDNRSSAVFILC